MRAVKTVLVTCGNLKQVYPDEIESVLILRALLDVNLPKFLSFDIPLFEGILSDLFPGVIIPTIDYSLMNTSFTNICARKNLQPLDVFFTKLVQTYEMMTVRHGFMMVGLPYAGKSTTLNLLAEILSELKDKISNPYYQSCQMSKLKKIEWKKRENNVIVPNFDLEFVNPKAVTLGHLYGEFNPVSYEWSDGVAAQLFRSLAKDASSDRKWVGSVIVICKSLCAFAKRSINVGCSIPIIMIMT